MPERNVSFGLTVNGERQHVTVRAADTLLEVLRTELGLTGTKPSCEHGDCGACTVQVDGVSLKACLMLAVEAAGCQVRTIEGLRNERLQQEFIDKAALQCGYCTPGFLMNADALVRTCPDADEAVVREWLESNLCRCMSYVEIAAAVRAVLTDNGRKNGEL